jgi:hypothetical protein
LGRTQKSAIGLKIDPSPQFVSHPLAIYNNAVFFDPDFYDFCHCKEL